MSAPPSPGVSLAASLRASARCVRDVRAGRSLSDSLAGVDAALRPAVQDISYHVMRHLGTALAMRRQLVRQQPGDALLDALLLVALVLLDTSMRARQPAAAPDRPDVSDRPAAPTQSAVVARPDVAARRRGIPLYAPHTIVDQAVSSATGALHRYRGLINATLRNAIRRRDELLRIALEDPQAKWNYPDWWVAEIRRAYPETWQDVLRAGDQPGPMVLRVNARRATVAQVLDCFDEHGVQAHVLGGQAIQLARPAPVTALPGFAQGLWSVQDIAAQRAGVLLPLRPGMRVLDACAAPGGKTAHMLERESLDLLALDVDADRLARVGDNLTRLGLLVDSVRLERGDASDVSAWWDGRPFDAVLADVPCTGSGVVRRHPDIRWLRRAGDVRRTAALQARILDALWPTVAPGGHLLYVTCSVFPQEGEAQAVAFVQRHEDVRRLPAPGQVLPLQQDGMADAGDGFFYALFTKAPQGQAPQAG